MTIFSYTNADSNNVIFQWDSDLFLDANVSDIAEEGGVLYAHFQHSTASDIYSLEIQDGKVQIPNVLLQMAGAFRVFCYVNDETYGKTIVEERFNIVPRPQPPEYIYDPTPVITYPELVQLVEDLTILKTKLTMVDAMAETLPAGELATATVDDSGDGLTFIFGIPRGKDGKDAVVDPTLSHTGEAADAKATGDALAEKVDKVAGKKLSTNDFDDNEKAQTDFVRTHFYEGQTSLVFSEDNLENIYITAQENIVLDPAGSDYGSVYKGRIKEENELMTRVDVDVAINDAIDEAGQSDKGNTNNSAYTMRQTASQNFCSREKLQKIIGGTIAWNQLVENGDFSNGMTRWNISTTQGDSATVENGILILTPNRQYANVSHVMPAWVAGHKILHLFMVKPSETSVIRIYAGHPWVGMSASCEGGVWTLHAAVTEVSSSGTASLVLQDNKASDWGTVQFKNVVLFDLTKMFGTAIADYIYSLEQATAGAGVAFFRKLFPNDYYEYNTGSLKSVEGLQSHDTVGFNQWDEEWEIGTINNDTGVPVVTNSCIRSKNFIPVLPNMTYFLHIPVQGLVYEYDENKNYIGFKLGGSVLTAYSFITTAETRYLKFRTAPNYGTTYNHDICINLSWNGSRNGEYAPYVKHSYPLDASLTLRGVPTLTSAHEIAYNGDEYLPDGTVIRRFGYRAYQSGDESLANAITDGTNTVYLLSNPTTEQAEPYQETQICDDWGTEEFVGVSIPVGTQTFYPIDLKETVEALAEIPQPPTMTGTYTLKVVVTASGKTYKWE